MMRIWTLHPKYLDTKGLVAVWREALLAQKVLKGQTKGYKHHPQLERFRQLNEPMAAIATYLYHIYREAQNRGYHFDKEKIEPQGYAPQLTVTKGQLLYEWEHLKRKLRSRDREKYRQLTSVQEPEPHPLFRIVEGGVESWEARTLNCEAAKRTGYRNQKEQDNIA